jgi:hypothetical protein
VAPTCLSTWEMTSTVWPKLSIALINLDDYIAMLSWRGEKELPSIPAKVPDRSHSYELREKLGM